MSNQLGALPNPHATHDWVVAKFGGSSVGSAERWHCIEDIVRGHREAGRAVIVVCSAVGGVTDHLLELITTHDAGTDPAPRLRELAQLHTRHATNLGVDPRVIAQELSSLTEVFEHAERPMSPRRRACVLAHGELLSSRLGAARLAGHGLGATWIDARTLLRSVAATTDRAEHFLSGRCANLPELGVPALLDARSSPVIVTQGFIASDENGDTVLLGRGGSDASAAYLAAAFDAKRLEIWSDVPGLFTADPRHVPSARMLRRVGYAEAEAMGSLGAKALHPRTIEPCHRTGIPIHLGWTDHPRLPGTVIGGAHPPHGVKAITARRELAMISVWQPSSWQPVGFLAEVASRFLARGLSMDMITTSPSEIRVTVDLAAFPSARGELQALALELGEVSDVRIWSSVGSVSIVGSNVGARVLGSAALAAFGTGAVHMVVHAANGGHVSFVVDVGDVERLVAAAHAELIAPVHDASVFGDDRATLEVRLARPEEEAPCAMHA